MPFFSATCMAFGLASNQAVLFSPLQSKRWQEQSEVFEGKRWVSMLIAVQFVSLLVSLCFATALTNIR